MKAGIFGGTFDPIHNGHLITSMYVREIRNLDKIIFIPAYVSPHKLEVNTTPVEHRLNMVRLAVESYEDFEYSDFEISNNEISYTINTIKHLLNTYSELELIIGFDNLKKFNTWKNYEEILKICKLVVLDRKNSDDANEYHYNQIYTNSPEIEISGTEIRRRVKNNLPINNLVPDKVKEYIYKNNLYR